AAALRNDADVLNGSYETAGGQALNRGDVDGLPQRVVGAGDQPGGRRQEGALSGDLPHQAVTAVVFTQAAKYTGVDLCAETVVLDQRVPVEVLGVPGDEVIAGRQDGIRQFDLLEINLHPKAAEVFEGHAKSSDAR